MNFPGGGGRGEGFCVRSMEEGRKVNHAGSWDQLASGLSLARLLSLTGSCNQQD